jgi:hypothetical protein
MKAGTAKTTETTMGDNSGSHLDKEIFNLGTTTSNPINN